VWREIAMVAPTDTSMVPMRVSKAVALGDGDDLSNRALRESPRLVRRLAFDGTYSTPFDPTVR
jgi:hypothetical protein